MRASGILLPVFSLPGKYGIGGFTKEAYAFVDFLKEAGQSYWQILPLGPTGYGDSPYQSFSTFAGNPYFIDVEEFIKEGFLSEEECEAYSAETGTGVDYEKLYFKRLPLLRLAYERSNIDSLAEFIEFKKENAYWLEDYALFMAIKAHFEGKAWSEWDKEIRVRSLDALNSYKETCADEMNFYRFLQFYFAKQWLSLKEYANKQGIKIVGDIPIYVAFDSSDAWANPELFDLNEENIPNKVAGCPPDPFAVTGQLWGNPLYRWDYHKSTGYDWWLRRISYCFTLYDVVRIDHFRGFDEFYTIPYEDKTAEFGTWAPGPGFDLFETINKRLGDKEVIAEDLGFLTDSVRDLVKKTGYPGMKILQFAFGSGNENEYLPFQYGANSVVYTGTHDNETTRGWYQRISREEEHTRKHFDEYTGNQDESTAAMSMIRLAMASTCDTCIIPMQDYLNLDNEGRINTPSTLGNNWDWRMQKDALSQDLAKNIAKLTELFARSHN